MEWAACLSSCFSDKELFVTAVIAAGVQQIRSLFGWLGVSWLVIWVDLSCFRWRASLGSFICLRVRLNLFLLGRSMINKQLTSHNMQTPHISVTAWSASNARNPHFCRTYLVVREKQLSAPRWLSLRCNSDWRVGCGWWLLDTSLSTLSHKDSCSTLWSSTRKWS